MLSSDTARHGQRGVAFKGSIILRLSFFFLPLIAAAGLASQPVGAQLFIVSPDFRGAPVEGSEPGLGLPLPGATPEEYRAHRLWTLRSGLNVAALQCQFSPSLRTVENYNDLLHHHSAELAEAYTRLNGYFSRLHGVKEGQRLFDDYSTKTYNGFSTLYAQLGFCQTSASIGRDVIFAPKGGMGEVSRLRLRELRNSLVPAGERLFIPTVYQIRYDPLPPLDPACYDKKDRLRKICGGTAK